VGWVAVSLVVVESSQAVEGLASVIDFVMYPRHEDVEERDESGLQALLVPEHVPVMDTNVRALTQPNPCPPPQIYFRRLYENPRRKKCLPTRQSGPAPESGRYLDSSSM